MSAANPLNISVMGKNEMTCPKQGHLWINITNPVIIIIIKIEGCFIFGWDMMHDKIQVR